MNTPDLTKAKILAVDDDQRNLVIVKHMLQGSFRIKTVSSGEEAWQLIPTFLPDIVLLDILMPGMDGYELCHKIKADPQLHTTKIIILSGKATLDSRLKGYNFGADDYLTKPFEPEELIAKIKVFLKLKHFEEIDALKNTFLNLINHETKTPISQILGYAELLLSSPLGEDQKSWIKTIIDAANLLHSHSNKIILLSHLKAGITLYQNRSPVKDLVLAAVAKVQSAANRKELSLKIQSDADFEVQIDPSHMELALKYVLENAIKFSPDRGEITIHTLSQGKQWLLNVSDQGPGITAQPLENIFNEFAVENIMHHKEGLKISLAIARKVAKAHGGSLEAKNNDPGGATFTFCLPLA